jgi:hypothetical protein
VGVEGVLGAAGALGVETSGVVSDWSLDVVPHATNANESKHINVVL